MKPTSQDEDATHRLRLTLTATVEAVARLSAPSQPVEHHGITAATSTSRSVSHHPPSSVAISTSKIVRNATQSLYAHNDEYQSFLQRPAKEWTLELHDRLDEESLDDFRAAAV